MIFDFFGTRKKAIIAMAHIGAMPGSPLYDEKGGMQKLIDGVAADIVTLWVPLGDSPLESGGLLYLEGSHEDLDLEAAVRADAPQDRVNDLRPLTHDLKWKIGRAHV